MRDETRSLSSSLIRVPAERAYPSSLEGSGTANRSDEIRPMTSAGYLAPWFRMPQYGDRLPCAAYDTLSPRGQQFCRFLVEL